MTADEIEALILNDFGAAMAVRAAARCGMLEQLANGDVPRKGLSLPPHQGALLVDLLIRAGLVEWAEDHLRPRPGFAALLRDRRRDLVARVNFTLLAAADLIMGQHEFFGSKSGFMQHAGTFGFYAYDAAHDTSPEALRRTEPWVRHVSALSRAEAPLLRSVMLLDGTARVLEIGGNSGAFAHEMLRHWTDLHWCIADLPAVCALGEAARPADLADRLQFLPGDARQTRWPEADVILFKSVLHDWEDDPAEDMLARAARALPPGGRLVVVERGPVHAGGLEGNLSVASNLVFAQFYRDPEWYEAGMRSLGLSVAPRATVQIDMPFHVITGQRA